MISVVLAILAIGQWACGPTGCSPAPRTFDYGRSFGFSEAWAPTVVQPAITEIQILDFGPTPTYGWEWITHNDVKFQVWGYFTAGNNGRWILNWDPALRQNKANYWAAAKRADAVIAPKAPLGGVVPKPPATAPKQPPPNGPPRDLVSQIDTTPKRDEPDMKSSAGPPLSASDQPDGLNARRKDDRPLTNLGKTLNFGLDPSKMNGTGYTINGEKVSTKFVEGSLDARREQKAFITVIGSTEERAKVVEDWKSDPRFQPFTDMAWLAGYDKSEWQVDNVLGFSTAEGHPTILVQAADGTVLLRDDRYPGPNALIEALRKAHPLYNPARDPAPSRPSKPVVPSVSMPRPLLLFALLAVALAVVLIPRRTR